MYRDLFFLLQEWTVLPQWLQKKCQCVSYSVVSDSATPWAVACQASLSMEFSRQEYWSGWPFPFPGDLPNPGIKPKSPVQQAVSLPLKHLESPQININILKFLKMKLFSQSNAEILRKKKLLSPSGHPHNDLEQPLNHSPQFQKGDSSSSLTAAKEPAHCLLRQLSFSTKSEEI